MDPSQEVVKRLGSIESQMYEVRRGIAGVRSQTPGITRIAIGVAAGLFLYSAICMIVMILFWGFIAAAIVGGAAAAGQKAGGGQTVSPLPRTR